LRANNFVQLTDSDARLTLLRDDRHNGSESPLAIDQETVAMVLNWKAMFAAGQSLELEYYRELQVRHPSTYKNPLQSIENIYRTNTTNRTLKLFHLANYD
jgi:hypothetical protein